MIRDDIFKKPLKSVPRFEFNEQVASAFDDMIERSVPFYREIIKRQARIIRKYYKSGTRIFDLGCSNGNLGLELVKEMEPVPFEVIAVDSSMPMIACYEKKLKSCRFRNNISLVVSDVLDVNLTNASVVVINFTLQFLPEKSRDLLMKKIYNGLVPGGILLFSEKIIHQDRDLSDLQIEFYYDFKRENGYSDLEISQKREALENILIPETIDIHMKRLNDAGFCSIDIWMKWFNFCSWICVK